MNVLKNEPATYATSCAEKAPRNSIVAGGLLVRNSLCDSVSLSLSLSLSLLSLSLSLSLFRLTLPLRTLCWHVYLAYSASTLPRSWIRNLKPIRRTQHPFLSKSSKVQNRSSVQIFMLIVMRRISLSFFLIAALCVISIRQLAVQTRGSSISLQNSSRSHALALRFSKGRSSRILTKRNWRARVSANVRSLSEALRKENLSICSALDMELTFNESPMLNRSSIEIEREEMWLSLSYNFEAQRRLGIIQGYQTLPWSQPWSSWWIRSCSSTAKQVFSRRYNEENARTEFPRLP